MNKLYYFVPLILMLLVPAVSSQNETVTSNAYPIVTVTHPDGTVDVNEEAVGIGELVAGLALLFFLIVGIITTFGLFPYFLVRRYHRSQLKRNGGNK